jgi:hypothetical protein
MRRALIPTLLVLAAVGVSGHDSRAAAKGPFSGWLKAVLESDSIWENCKLTVFVDEHGRGSIERECQWKESEQGSSFRDSLSSAEIGELRALLRGADLFEGQFWGHDLRGIDLALVTLTVNDESKVATVVCFRNPSFETGNRERLLAWLTKRLRQEKPDGK